MSGAEGLDQGAVWIDGAKEYGKQHPDEPADKLFSDMLAAGDAAVEAARQDGTLPPVDKT